MRLAALSLLVAAAGCRTLGTTTPPSTEPKAVGPVAGKAAKVKSELTTPVKQVSGLAGHRGIFGGPHRDSLGVVVVGDAAPTIAGVAVTDGNKEGPLRPETTRLVAASESHDMGKLVPPPAPKWEAVATADEQYYLLDTSAGRIVVTSPAGKLEQTILVDFAKLGPFKPSGEGLVLLKNGHFVVLVTGASPQLVELGPDGEAPLGIAPGMVVEPGEGFPLPAGAQRTFVPLKSWHFDGPTAGVMGRVRELTIGPDQQLYVLSEKRIGRLGPKLRTFDDLAVVGTYWEIPAGLEHPGGLAFVDDFPVIGGGEKIQLLEPLED